MNSMMEKARAEFQKSFGAHKKLKPKQEEVLQHLADGKSVFAGLPTGYGKSICYCLPAMAWKWRIIVLCPLISLMEDQRQSLKALKLSAVVFHSGLNEREKTKAREDFLEGNWQVCLLSPEKFCQWRENGFFKNFFKIGIDLIVLDEMHCIDDWSHFREGYQKIFEPLKRLTQSGIPILGLSASMNLRASELWMRDLCEDPEIINTGLERNNIFLEIAPIEEEKFRWVYLVSALKELKSPSSALVYCATRKECDEVSQWLNSAGFESISYHAGIPPKLRKIRSDSFKEGNLRVVCCTSAFGLGIDYPRVSLVIHFSLPYGLNSYWQEVGRAGRDGEKAKAICFWRRSEVNRSYYLGKKEKAEYFYLWKALISKECRRVLIGNYLGLNERPCGNCDNCEISGESVISSEMQAMLFFQSKKIWWLDESAKISDWLMEKFSVD